ncbi:MAG: hypothetical protein ACW96U_00820 [Candidatus Heimdallarchaeaceae archaeon]
MCDGVIKLLVRGRSSTNKFWKKWVSIPNYEKFKRNGWVIRKEERTSCCYTIYSDDLSSVINHCESEEHIRKLIAKIGVDNDKIKQEVRYYTIKILEGK